MPRVICIALLAALWFFASFATAAPIIVAYYSVNTDCSPPYFQIQVRPFDTQGPASCGCYSGSCVVFREEENPSLPAGALREQWLAVDCDGQIDSAYLYSQNVCAKQGGQTTFFSWNTTHFTESCVLANGFLF
jgi:hypothetical protein